MTSTFFGFTITMRAMMAAQKGLEVTAHNIANANTPGYSRQRAVLTMSDPFSYPGINRAGGTALQLGTGVSIRSIERMRDTFLDHIVRHSTTDFGQCSAKAAGFSRIEVALNEPSDNGLSSVVTEFFNSFSELSKNPELRSERENVREKGVNLVTAFNQLNEELTSLRNEQDQNIQLTVTEINNLLGQVYELNTQISAVENVGDNANDLRDQRDILIDQLSNLTNVETTEEATGALNVFIGGITVVDSANVIRLNTTPDPNRNDGQLVVALENGLKPAITGGELKGYLDVRDEIIPQYENKLNYYASALINRVNYQHKQGYSLDGHTDNTFFREYRVASQTGLTTLPVGTTEETTIDTLGITAGNFFVQGSRIEITSDDVRPGEAITLGELIERVNDTQPFARLSLQEGFLGSKLQFDLYNPPDADMAISLQKGSSNFLDQFSGLLDAEMARDENSKGYTTAMEMIGVSLSILDSDEGYRLIAAASESPEETSHGVGNNENALAIAELNDRMDAFNGSSFTDYYNGMIGDLGSQVQANNRLVDNQVVLLTQLENQRASVSGVSIDEESMNMIQYQRAFEGAAKVSLTLDSIIKSIIYDIGAG
jgi:flagellar hook-associated protein 1 FlgK